MQSLLFLDQFSLLGKKREVYVLLKILRFCTGSSAKSYQCKYAIDERLHNLNPEKIDFCDALTDVLQFPSLRGKFSSVHEDLRAEGITGVEITKDGFQFLRDALERPDLVSTSADVAAGWDNEDEEEMLNQAIALSMEATLEESKEPGNDDKDGQEGEFEEDNKQLLRDAIALSLKETNDNNDNDGNDGEKGTDDQDVLNQAIALSLDEVTEDEDDLFKQAIALSLTD